MRSVFCVAWLVLAGCGPAGGWQWQRFPAFREFGSFSGLDGADQPWASTGEGALRFDDLAYRWVPVPTPGANATFTVTPDGHEYVSTYGLYTRPSATADWQLLGGSRALSLSFVGKDERGNLYARTTVVPPAKAEGFVRLSGEEAWVKVDFDASVFTSFVNDPLGRLYAVDGSQQRLLRLEGTTSIELQHPRALTFDAQGRRHQARLPFTVERVSEAGALEHWHSLVGSGTPVLSSLLGFGKDGRFYALVGEGAELPSGERTERGDLLSIGAGEPAWRLAAKVGLNGDDSPGGPLTLDSYGGGFARDGSLYFGGCESGCAGRNSFSYGLYRLTLGGQP